MEGFAVTCPLAPDASRLLSGFCPSPRSFGFGFLQTPPHGDALAVSLAFGSAKTRLSDFHRHSSVPCPAHTSVVKRARPLLPRVAFDHAARAHCHFTSSSFTPRPERRLSRARP